MLKGQRRIDEIDNIWKRIEEKCKINNLILVTKKDEYINSQTILKYYCEKHVDRGLLSRNVAKFLYSEKGCKYCGYDISSEKNKTIRNIFYEDVKKDFEKRGYTLLSPNYENNRQQLSYICSLHPHKIQTITYSRLKQGQGCSLCGDERTAQSKILDISVVRQEFEKRNLTLISENYYHSEQQLDFICNIHKEEGIQHISYESLKYSMYGCTYCARQSRSGKNHHNYKGGLTSINSYLRGRTRCWTFDSFNYYNRTCIITGIKKGKRVVHHLYGFDKIVNETLSELNYPIYKDITKYTYKELTDIENLCLKKHYEHGFGVCLISDIHELFHSYYGKGNNTPEQFYEFQEKIKNGEIKIAS
jgi:hypothetical protein